ncbi:hypothetical protein [Nostoc sp. PA-18-2419]|uniref:hypothetical protein n=1 Tax=Nostoc sp. PA-18-2419 TaxID=2575443 RepID=UPI0011095DA6|nr:hypothetical protein [Nostoc sp. PA-18-2419]
MGAEQLGLEPPTQAQEQTEAPLGGINTAAKEDTRFLQKLLLANATANTPPEWRESLKLISAGLLGISLWFFIGWIAGASYLKIQDYSEQISKLKDSKDPQIENLNKAVSIINDASKTLYSQLIPIATVVSGFFFVAANSQSSGLVAPKNKTEPPEADKEEK